MEDIVIYKHDVRELSTKLEENHWNTLIDHLRKNADKNAERAVLWLTEDQHKKLTVHVERYVNAEGEERAKAFEKLLKLMEEYVRNYTREYLLDQQ